MSSSQGEVMLSSGEPGSRRRRDAEGGGERRRQRDLSCASTSHRVPRGAHPRRELGRRRGQLLSWGLQRERAC